MSKDKKKSLNTDTDAMAVDVGESIKVFNGKTLDRDTDAALCVVVSAGEDTDPYYNQSYPLHSAPASADIISETSREAGIDIPDEYGGRLIRQLDVMRENPTTTEWSFGIQIGEVFIGFKQKREFAKISEREEIKGKK